MAVKAFFQKVGQNVLKMGGAKNIFVYTSRLDIHVSVWYTRFG